MPIRAYENRNISRLQAPSDRLRSSDGRLLWKQAVLEANRGSLEGVGSVLTSDVCHLKADILVITETQLF